MGERKRGRNVANEGGSGVLIGEEGEGVVS